VAKNKTGFSERENCDLFPEKTGGIFDGVAKGTVMGACPSLDPVIGSTSLHRKPGYIVRMSSELNDWDNFIAQISRARLVVRFYAGELSLGLLDREIPPGSM
jgi:hypothetical protein